MNRLRHWSRLTKFLIRQRLQGFEVPKRPLFDEESTAFFTRKLPSARYYVEYGSGGSTILANELQTKCLSIESDKYYAKSVRRQLSKKSSVQLCYVDIGLTGFWGMPVFRKLTSHRLAAWSQYVEAPFSADLRSDDFPDFVLIDGRFRRACALRFGLEAQKHSTPVTLMIDDYFSQGREHLHDVEQFLGKPKAYGRAAVFEVDSTNTVTSDAIKLAKQDFR